MRINYWEGKVDQIRKWKVGERCKSIRNYSIRRDGREIVGIDNERQCKYMKCEGKMLLASDVIRKKMR